MGRTRPGRPAKRGYDGRPDTEKARTSSLGRAGLLYMVGGMLFFAFFRFGKYYCELSTVIGGRPVAAVGSIHAD